METRWRVSWSFWAKRNSKDLLHVPLALPFSFGKVASVANGLVSPEGVRPMTAKASEADLDFRDAFEAGQIAPDDFHHREHLRLAYAYLCECNLQDAYERVHAALKNFLKINSVPP